MISNRLEMTDSDGEIDTDATEIVAVDLLDVTQTAVPIASPEKSVTEGSSPRTQSGFSSGRLIGEFQIRRQIGRGGMAYVYEAWQESLRRSVALKVLPFWSSTDPRQIARLKNEARALAHLEHENIVPVYAVGEDGGVHYLAMRLIDGAPLDAVIRVLREPPDSTPKDTPEWHVASLFANSGEDRFRTIARLGVTVARALHAAHEYGVVHRDIKPSNILIGRDGRPWIADFGLAHCDTATHLTRPGAFVGTPRYASPEQASGESALVDHRTDIYSLGLTLFELVTLSPAFDRTPGSPDAFRYDRETPRLRRQQPDIPADLENIILKAASPVRDERYATARDLASDLDRFLAGEVTHARRPGLTERMTRWSRRHVRGLVSFTALVMLLLAASVMIGGMVFQEKLKTETALENARRNFRQARTVVDEFGAELTEQLALVPGTEHIRRELLLETIGYYRDFIEQSEDRTELHADLAVALNKIALLTEQVATTEEALTAHLDALAAFEQLCREQPDSHECRADLALSENNIGMLLSRTQDRTRAEHHFRRAIALQKRLVDAHPKIPRYQRELGLSKNNLGMLLSKCPGSWSESADLYQSAIALFEASIETEPGHAATRRYLATAYSNQAALLGDNHVERAVEALQHSIAVLEDAVQRRPDCGDTARDLALSLNSLGAQQSRLSGHAAAADAYQRASRIQYDLLRRAPQSQTHRRDIAVSENNIGLALARAGSHSDAEAAFRRAIQFQSELTIERPDDRNDTAALAGIWNNLGMVLETRSQLSESSEAYLQAIALLSDVFHTGSADDGVRQNLSRTYFNYSRVLLSRGYVDRAVEYAIRRRGLWPAHPDRLLSVAEQLVCAADRVHEVSRSSESRLSHADCAELVAQTLELAIAAGLDPCELKEKRLSDWLCPNETPSHASTFESDSAKTL